MTTLGGEISMKFYQTARSCQSLWHTGYEILHVTIAVVTNQIDQSIIALSTNKTDVTLFPYPITFFIRWKYSSLFPSKIVRGIGIKKKKKRNKNKN